MARVFYMAGLPRSGSTLLMQLIAQNPDIHSTPTSGLVDCVNGTLRGYSNSVFIKAAPDENKEVLKFYKGVRALITNWHAGHGNVMDKNREWLNKFELLRNAFGEPPKIIVPIRDLRGVLSSMELGWRRYPELQASNPESWNSLEGRVAEWLKSGPLGVSIDWLKEAINRGHISDVLVVRMEDLCTSPTRVFSRVYEYLGLPDYDHDFHNVKQVTQENDALHRPFGDHSIIEGPVLPYKSEWDRVVPEGLGEAVVESNRWFYDRFYPEVITKVCGD